MTDILERLKGYCKMYSDPDLLRDAAEEIQQLRAELMKTEQRSIEWENACSHWEEEAIANQTRNEMMAVFIRKWVDVGPDNKEMMEDLEGLELK